MKKIYSNRTGLLSSLQFYSMNKFIMRLTAMFAVLFLIIAGQSNLKAQAIQESFEEAGWVNGAATNASAAIVGATVPGGAGGSSWSYSALSITSNTGTVISRAKTGKGVEVRSTGSSFLCTPRFSGGIVEVTAAVYPTSSSTKLLIGVATAATTATAQLTSSYSTTSVGSSINGIWSMSMYSAGVNMISGQWNTITFTTSVDNTKSAYLKFQRCASGSVIIDDIVVTAPSVGTTPPTLTAAVGATVDAPFTVTYPTDDTWRDAITAIKIGGTTLTAGYNTATSGQITFTPSASTPANLLQTNGSKSVVIEATGYANATVTQAIGVGALAQMAITTQPVGPATNGGTLATQPVVTLQDQYGNTTASTQSVTADEGAGSTWTIGGTTTLNAVAGVATFTNLTASTSGSAPNSTIKFSTSGASDVTSSSFVVPVGYMDITAFETPVSENFNSLATTGTSSSVPDGWYFTEVGGNTTYAADAGGTATGNTYSYGTGTNSDRAFGGLRSGSVTPTIGAQFKNSTGSTIQSLEVTYTGEQWRLGSAGRADRWDFQYSLDATSLSTGTYTDVDNLDFSSPNTTTTGALDGNAGANRTAITFTITGLSIPDGSNFWFRWNDIDASSSDDGLSVDDFSIQAITVATPDVTLGDNGTQVGAANIAQATNNNIIYNFKLDVLDADATLNQVTIPTSGTYVGADLTNLKLWYHTSNTFGSASAIKTISAAGAGTETFNTLTQSITAGTSAYFWVTADVAGGATVGNTLTVTPALQQSNFTFAESVTFNVGTINAGGTQTITAGTSEVTLSAISAVSAGDMPTNSVNNELFNFKIEVADVAAEITEVNLPNTGTYTTGDFDNLKLWYNSTNDFGTASTLATISTPANNDPQAFTGFTQSVGIGATGYFWVTGDASATPTEGNDITAGGLTGGDITFSGSVNVTGSVSAGGTQTFTTEPDLTLDEISTVGAANIAQATTNNIIYNFQIAVSNASTTLTGLVLPNSGTYTSGDLANLKLWYSTTNSFGGASTIATISSPVFDATQSFTPSQLLSSGTTAYFWVTADVAGAGVIGNTIEVSTALQESDFTFNTPVLFNVGTIGTGGTQTITAGTSQVTLSAISAVGAGSINGGSTNNILSNFKLEVTDVAAELTDVNAPNSGTYASGDFDNLKLWYNSTNDFGTATTKATLAAPNNSDPQSFTGFTQSIGIGNTGYFWITGDVSGSAVLGNTITMGSLGGGDITFSGSVNVTGTAAAGGEKTIALETDPSDAFQSQANGQWGNLATWQSFTGGNWINATSLPTTAASSITVKDSVSIPSGSVTADDVIVSSTGILQIVSGATFVVANGAAAFDVSVSGLLRNSGTLTLTGAAEVNSGGTFDHNIAAFAIPSITWNVGSTLKISGIATVSGQQNLTGIQSVYNLIYDCPSQSAHTSNANYTVLGAVSGVDIQGNFTVNSTGAGLLLLTAGGTANLPVAGNYLQTGGYTAISRGGSALRQLSVTGNVTISGGTMDIGANSGSNPYNLTVGGNLDVQTGGTLTGSFGNRSVIFNGSSAQQFSNTGTFSGAVGIQINNLSGVTINNAVSVGGSTTSLTAGTITHGGNLTVQTGSTITVVDGTFATVPTFAGTVSLTYANTVAKTVGSSNELPGTNSVIGLSTAGGSAEVTIDSDLAVTGAITVTGGDLKIAATRTVTWSGSVASSLASGKTFTVDGTLNRSHTGTFTVSGTLTYSATGKYVHAQAAGTIPAATWTAGSLCEVTLQTSSAPGGLGQAFADFNWNCQTQSQAMGLSNALNNVTGTLTIAGTNNQELRLASTTSSTYNFANINVSGANSAAKLILSSSSGVSTVNTTGNVTIGAAGTISFNTAASIMNVGGNWTNNGTFTAGSNGTVNFNGSSAQTFAASGTGNFYKLTVNNSSTGLDLSNSATVTNALTLTAGRVNTGVNSLIVTSTGSIARTSGYVNGFLQRTVVNGANSFPVGSASAYTPATVTMSGVSGAVDLTATAILGNPVASGSAINPAAKTDHYWNITKSGAGTFTSYSALFDFTNATNTGTTANYIVRKYDSGPGWTTPSSSVTGTTLTATGLTSFSDFEIGEFDCENPAITVNPAASQELCEGETATDISVTATGDFLTYQWYSNVTNANTGGVSVGASNGGQTDTYTPQTGTPGTTYYYCVVTGGCGSPQSSSTSEVIVNEAPAITAESLAGATYGQGFGGAAAISVTATGTGLTYQWYSNATASNTGGTLLSGEESNTITPSTATIGILYYYCEVSGTCSPAVTSNVSGAIEIVASCTEPVFSTQPTDNQTECVGGTLTLGTVAASETPTYQWYSNATKSNIGGTSVGAVNGGQTDTYTPPSATPGTYYYYVIATNGACPTRSNAVEIEILAPPSISAQSTAGASYALNASATALTVTASGAGTLTYQWYSNATASNSGGTSVGAANGGQTNSFTPPTTSLGTTYYYCVVSGDCTPAATSAVSGAISIVQYSIGDYGSNSGGSWTSTATWRTWTGSGWSGSAPGVVPTTTSNVYILSGHTVTVPSSGTRTCANLTVDGTLTSSSITAVESPQYLSIYGSTITVNTGGFVGNSSTPTGDDADALGFQLYNTTGNNTKTFTGSGGSLYLSRVQYMNSGITIVVDRDMTITYHGGTNQGGHTAGIYPTSGTTDNSVLTINAGKTLTFAPWSCLTTTSSSNAIPTGVNMTVNVNGTLTLQDSPAPNGNNPAQNSFIYGGVGTGKLFTLNIGSTGIVNAPQFYPNGTTSGGAVGTGTDASVTVAAGGVFNVSKIIDLRKPTQTITGGGTFNLTGASQIRVGHANGLSATGAIQTSSSSFSSTADYSFEGTAAQVTGNGLPTTVNNFTVANAAGVTLQGNLTTNGLATVSSGSLTIAAGKRLTMAGAGTNAFGGNLVTLKSDLTGTATIGTIAGSLTGATNVEAERYVRQNTFRGWRMLAVPTKGSQTLNASWQEGATSYTDNPNPGFGTRITANTPSAVADGYDAQTFGNSLLSYTPGTSPAWVGVTSPTTSTAVATTSGWMLYVRGNRTVDTAQQITSPTETVLRTRGELYVGNETVSTVSGFNLVGNIYASEIDFTNLNRTSVSNKFYVWDPKLAGSYGLGAFQSFSSPDWLPTPGGGSYGNTLNTKIQSGMAFLVESIGAGSVGFTESAKSAGINGAANGFRPSAGFSYISTNLYAGSGAAASLADGNRTFFDEGFSNDVDVNDVLKASNFGEGIGMYRDGKLLQTERRKPVAENDYIEYRITGAKTMKYKLEFVPTSVTLNGIEAFLEDKYLNTVTPVPLNVTSSIEFNANASQVATFANRFKLVFRAAGTVPVRFTTVKATQQGTSMHVEWTVAAETGITKYEVEHSTNGTNFTKVGEQAAQANTGATVSYSWLDATPAAGINYYRVKSVNASGEVVYTTIVKVVNGQVISSIVLVSNPVRNNVINMQFNNQEKGNYVVKVMDSKGQQVVIDRVAHTGGNATVGINLPAVAKGMYQVEVQSPNTSRKSFKVVVE